MRVQAAVSSTLVWLPATLGIFLRGEDGSLVRMSMEKRAGPGDIVRVPLTIAGDGAYSMNVQMGTPFQDIPCALSLSQNFIVVATGDADDNGNFFFPAKSSSFTKETNFPPVQITSAAGDNTQQATFARESCSIQDFPYNASLALTPHAQAAKVVPSGCSGILGFGVDPVKTAPADANLLGLYLPPGFTAAECGFQLNRVGDSSGGLFVMGGRDPNAYKGDFTNLVVPPAAGDIASRPSWSVPLDGLQAEATGGSHSVAAGLASVDPLYTDISVPMGDVAQIYANVPGAKVADTTGTRYFVPCDAKINLKLTFAGREFVMDSRDGVVQEGATCFGGVRGTSGNVYKVGANFLRNVYTIFGATVANGNATFTVGFANLADSTGTASASGTNTGAGASPTSSAAPTGNGAISFARTSNFVVGAVVAGLGLGFSVFF